MICPPGTPPPSAMSTHSPAYTWADLEPLVLVISIECEGPLRRAYGKVHTPTGRGIRLELSKKNAPPQRDPRRLLDYPPAVEGEGTLQKSFSFQKSRTVFAIFPPGPVPDVLLS